ncbi:MAG: hypothetical protein J0H99_25990, partial [Rhodospirillales bacterium]|nr:hypothetical protein [Rhodospirillales bacterium]
MRLARQGDQPLLLLDVQGGGDGDPLLAPYRHVLADDQFRRAPVLLDASLPEQAGDGGNFVLGIAAAGQDEA